MLLSLRRPDGTWGLVRPPYEPRAYTASDDALEALRGIRATESLAEACRDGLLAGYTRVTTWREGGRAWHVFQANGSEHCVAIEDRDGEVGAVLPVPPELAWTIALARDRVRPGGPPSYPGDLARELAAIVGLWRRLAALGHYAD